MCKNGWTDRFAVWVVDWSGPKDAQVQSYSPGGANMPSYSGHIGATWRIRLKRPSAAAMRLYALCQITLTTCLTLIIHWLGNQFLANVNSFTFARWCRPSVCRLSSVTLVHPTQAVVIFGVYIFIWHSVPWPFIDIQSKFYGDRPRGTPTPRELITRWAVKYSDFGNVSRYEVS